MRVQITRTIVWIVESPDSAKKLNEEEQEDGFMYDLTRLDSAQHISTTDVAKPVKE